MSILCKIYYITSVLSDVYAIPVCHLLDQVSDHHKTDSRNPPSSYSKTTQMCWRTLLHFYTLAGHIHLHPDHICRGRENKMLLTEQVKLTCITVREQKNESMTVKWEERKKILQRSFFLIWPFFSKSGDCLHGSLFNYLTDLKAKCKDTHRHIHLL